MEFKLEQFSGDQIYAGRQLFKTPAEFVLGVARLDQLPITDMPEVAFAGRSNVGKSSLIKRPDRTKGACQNLKHTGTNPAAELF